MRRRWTLGAAAAAATAAIGAYFIWVHEPDYGGEPGVAEAAAWLATLGPGSGRPVTPSNVGRVTLIDVSPGSRETGTGASLGRSEMYLRVPAGAKAPTTLAPLARLPLVDWIQIFNVGNVSADDTAAAFADNARLRNYSWRSSATITPAGLAHIGRMKKLRRLHLSQFSGDTPPNIVGLKHFAGLVEIELIDVEGIDGDDEGLEALSRLPKLRTLDLYRARLSAGGISHFAAMKSLVNLKLQNARIEGSLAPLARAPALARLDVTRSTVDDAQLGSLVGAPMIELVIAEHVAIGNKALAAFASMPKLERLELEGARIEGDLGVLAAAPALRAIDLWSTSLDDARGAGLGRIKTLKTVILRETAVGDKTGEAVGTLPLLEFANFTATKITDASLRHLAAAPKLHTLGLMETGIGDDGVAHLVKAPALKMLILHKTRITDAALVHLAAIKTLGEIYIGETAVTDAGVEKLRQARPALRINR